MADDIGWEAVTLKGELAHRASSISISLSGQPSLCDNAVSCGLSDGLPIGMMLIAEHHAETTIYRAAHAFEQARDWKTP